MNALNEDNTLTETFVSQLYELDKTLAELKEQRENLVELIKKEMKLKEVKQIDHEHLVASIKAGYTKVNFDSTLLKQTHPE
jgi:predicted nucleotidyltransferase